MMDTLLWVAFLVSPTCPVYGAVFTGAAVLVIFALFFCAPVYVAVFTGAAVLVIFALFFISLFFHFGEDFNPLGGFLGLMFRDGSHIRTYTIKWVPYSHLVVRNMMDTLLWVAFLVSPTCPVYGAVFTGAAVLMTVAFFVFAASYSSSSCSNFLSHKNG